MKFRHKILLHKFQIFILTNKIKHLLSPLLIFLYIFVKLRMLTDKNLTRLPREKYNFDPVEGFPSENMLNRLKRGTRWESLSIGRKSGARGRSSCDFVVSPTTIDHRVAAIELGRKEPVRQTLLLPLSFSPSLFSFSTCSLLTMKFMA